MTAPLHILFVEDNEDDAELMALRLRKDGYMHEWRRVDTETAFLEALDQADIDLILADYSLPGFGALRVLDLLKEKHLEVPVIVVTGAVSEETTVACMRRGAADYLLKDRLARLGPATAQALEQRQLRLEQRLQEAERQRHNREIAVLNRVISAAATSLEPGQVLQIICRELCQALELPFAVAAMLDQDKQNLMITAEYIQGMELTLVGRQWSLEQAPRLAQMVLELEPLLLDNTRGNSAESILVEPAYRFMRSRGLGDLLVLPLLVGGTLAGMIGLAAWEGRNIQPDEIRLAQNATVAAAPVLQNARLFEETRQRAAELAALADVSQALRAATNLEEILVSLLQKTVELVGASVGCVFLVEPPSYDLELQACWPPAPQAHGIRCRADIGLIAEIMASGQRVFFPKLDNIFAILGEDCQSSENLPELTPEQDHFLQTLSARITSHLVIPLMSQDRGVGMLHLGFENTRQLEEISSNLLNALADLAGNAIQRGRYNNQVQRSLERLEALRSIDMAISASLDLRVTLMVLVEQTLNLLKASAVCLLLLDAQTQRLEYAAGRGFRTSTIQRELRVGQGCPGKVALERKIITITDFESHSQSCERAKTLQSEGFKVYCAVPLIAKGNIKGVLEVFFRQPIAITTEMRSLLETLAGQAAIAVDNAALFETVQRTNLELSLAYDVTIEGWARTLEMRKVESPGHSLRVRDIMLRLCQGFGLDANQMTHIRRGILLHDIGMIGLPDAIIQKEGPLTEPEWALVREHPERARELLAPIAILRPALEIPYAHHEKWDGSGYPRGLKGRGIPLAARLFAVVDVWDAMSQDRPFRRALPRETIRQYLRSQAGQHFDPEIVSLFLTEIVGL